MPRPPVEYIKETQEEDERVRLTMNGVDLPGFDSTPSDSRKGSPIPYGAVPALASPTSSDFNGSINGKPLAGAAKDIKPSASYGSAFPDPLLCQLNPLVNELGLFSSIRFRGLFFVCSLFLLIC